MDGIHEMFAELAGWEQQEFDFAFALESVHARKRQYDAERMRDTSRYSNAWAKRNPDRAREYRRRSKQRARQRDPERYRKMRALANARYRAKHAERLSQYAAQRHQQRKAA